jgi:hypothetical protein
VYDKISFSLFAFFYSSCHFWIFKTVQQLIPPNFEQVIEKKDAATESKESGM